MNSISIENISYFIGKGCLHRMKRKDITLVVCFALLAGVLLIFGFTLRTGKTGAQTKEERILANIGTNEQASVIDEAVQTYLSENSAEAYLLMKTSSRIYAPIPLNEENSFRIVQRNGDYNTVHIGINSFYMEDSNCENHDCVKEGTVTLDNMHTRVLYNMIVCLPHQLSLEMITPEEAEAVLYELYTQQLADSAEGKNQAESGE